MSDGPAATLPSATPLEAFRDGAECNRDENWSLQPSSSLWGTSLKTAVLSGQLWFPSPNRSTRATRIQDAGRSLP
jgi:hypothetical protein